ncbi:MAG: hypothetical protein HKN17_00230, partial [Rhodothermales bacterium]|nr:hypothetical protein [Rhodothermales bacterium]
VDYRSEQRYREQLAFPGLEIDELGGTSFARLQTELMLPPIRLRSVGGGSFYLKWLRPSVFGTGIATNVDAPSARTRAVNVGVQLDARIMLFSYLRTTLSAGWAQAWIEDGRSADEFMISFKIL